MEGTIMTTYVTLYKAAEIINHLFKEEGIERSIKPQRLYNYNSKGKLGVETDGNKIELAEIKKLYDLIKAGKTSSKQTAADLAAQIMGM